MNVIPRSLTTPPLEATHTGAPLIKSLQLRPRINKTESNVYFRGKSPSGFTSCCVHVWMYVDICGEQRGGDGACAASQCTSVQKGPEGAVLQG